MSNETHVFDCSQCQTKVAAVVEGQYGENDESGNEWACLLLRCPTCKGPFLARQTFSAEGYTPDGEAYGHWRISLLYPSVPYELGPPVPKNISSAYREARLCFLAGAHTACALMCRKAIECLCAEFSANGSNLKAQLKHLLDQKKLDERLYTWADQLRLVGNEAAHDTSFSAAKDEATDIMDFTRALMEYVFVFEERFKQFMSRRKERKDSPASAP